MKRFQECNKIEKVWRYRWYLPIPFLWVWFSSFQYFRVYKDEVVDGVFEHTNEYDVMKGKMLWKLLMGDAQIKMNWTYTPEEVMNSIKEKLHGKI